MRVSVCVKHKQTNKQNKTNTRLLVKCADLLYINIGSTVMRQQQQQQLTSTWCCYYQLTVI